MTCQSQPILAFNSVRWTKTERGHWGGNWEGVYSFNLSSKELLLRLSEKNLALDEPHIRAWITELISLSEDAESVYVNLAVEKAVQDGGVVHHFLARVGLNDGKVELLAALKDIRY